MPKKGYFNNVEYAHLSRLRSRIKFQRDPSGQPVVPNSGKAQQPTFIQPLVQAGLDEARARARRNLVGLRHEPKGLNMPIGKNITPTGSPGDNQ